VYEKYISIYKFINVQRITFKFNRRIQLEKFLIISIIRKECFQCLHSNF